MKRPELPSNYAPPLTMHIDLNSCFASIEQQANRLLRGRPVGVAAYDTPRGFVLAASYQAKARGVKLGVNVQQARQLCPGIVILAPDPAKYRAAHQRFKKILLAYTSRVHPKSIDEFVLDFAGSPAIRRGMTMEDIGLEIKEKIYQGLGEAVTVNVGIGPNRFLAKLAAGLHKPNGLERIDWRNLEQTYNGLGLLDLPGINIRYRRRLHTYGIRTPADFLKADLHLLQKVIFQSIVGYYWYLRLRGWEIDGVEFARRSIGHQYALPKRTADKAELGRLLMKLCEKVGRRLRRNALTASGIGLYLDFSHYELPSPSAQATLSSAELQQQRAWGPWAVREPTPAAEPRGSGFMGGDSLASGRAWHQGKKVGYQLYTTADIYQAAKTLLDRAVITGSVRGMSITVFELRPVDPEQLSLFATYDQRGLADGRRLSRAIDAANDRYGEFVVTPATMMDMRGEILDRIAFGAVKDM